MSVGYAPALAGQRRASAVAGGSGRAAKTLTPVASFKPGQSLEGRVTKRIKSGVVLDVGADKAAILDAGEVRDGFPVNGMPAKGATLKVRVLDTEDGELRVTARTGSLERPPRRRIALTDYDVRQYASFCGRWLDGQVFSISRWGVFVELEPVPGRDDTTRSSRALGLVRVRHFSDAFVDEACLGGKVRVRVVSVDADAGKIELSMRDAHGDERPSQRQ